jgi:hypothetical protein
VQSVDRFKFCHVMLKETVSGLLGYEWKRTLHNYVARFYVERPDGRSDVKFMYAKAHHYYLAGNLKEARTYYELCGKEAGSAFTTQRMLECFQRLLEIDPEDATDLQRAVWSRRIGEAQIVLGRLDKAEVGFARPRCALLTGIAAQDALYNSLEILGLDCRDAEGEEGREESYLVSACTCGLMGGPARKSSYHEDPAPQELEDDDSSASTPTGRIPHRMRCVQPRLTAPAHPASWARAHRRRLSVVEPRGPLRPRLVKSLPAFMALRRTVSERRVSMEAREEAVDVLLEASRVCSLLGEINKDRASSEALERRWNAVLLAEAAALLPAHHDVDGDVSRVFQRVSDELARCAWWRCCRSDKAPRSYARAAVFFAGMHPSTKWRSLAPQYGVLANRIRDAGQRPTDGDLEQQVRGCGPPLRAHRG